MESISIKQVIFVRFPFSDLSDFKLRPAVVVAQANQEDWWLCQITSKAHQDPHGILLSKQDFCEGGLSLTSYIRPSKVFAAHYSLIEKTVGQLSEEKFQNIIQEMI